MNHQMQMPFMAPMTRMVKNLIIINVSLWLGLVIIVQQFFMSQPYLYRWFGLTPELFLTQFFIWQPVTYMFLHSTSIFHVVFNMLILWWFGSDLESRWGSKFFLLYYFVSGVGAALLYMLCIVIYYLVSGNILPLMTPVVGASGAIFGIILAYGILFGDRVIYFMMLFPMKARYFVMIIGAIELVTLLNTGVRGQVANLAHLGGLVSGFLFLFFWTRWRSSGGGQSAQRHRRRLKLVVDNERSKKGSSNEEPRYWN